MDARRPPKHPEFVGVRRQDSARGEARNDLKFRALCVGHARRSHDACDEQVVAFGKVPNVAARLPRT